MSENRSCPKCEQPLPDNAPSGICPQCLMLAGLQGSSDASGGSASPFAATVTPPSVFVPPDPATLSGYFPQLDILEALGHGGMGAVYKARQKKLDRMVALKIIRPEAAADAAFAERFNREARTLARLGHSSIVAVHDFGEVSLNDAEGTVPSRRLYFIVMEYVDGVNLRQMMQAGELESDQALVIISQICDALQYAHDEGVVHRDIKPENVLVDRRGKVKIADFGLAKLVTQSPEEYTLTQTHQVMGTPRYMAPEQMTGSHAVDHRADIYSLGVVFYEMLTGTLPMGRFEPPSQKAKIDVRIDDVVHKALASDPDQRYQRASEIRADVESIVFEHYSAISLAGGSPAYSEVRPGLSTVLENQVAGVVDRFRGIRQAEAVPKPALLSSAEREAVRRQVKLPAIALMLYALLALIPAAGLLTNGFDISDGNDRTPWYIGASMIAAGLLVLGIGFLVMRGGWHLLSLQNYRAALLGSFLGQPIGLWPLYVLSRPEVRNSFAEADSSARNPLVRLVLSTTLWGCLLCGAGIAMTFQPWGEVYNSVARTWASAAGFDWLYGMLACFALSGAALFLLATAAIRPTPIWRPIVVGTLSAVVLGGCVHFVTSFRDGTAAIQPLLHAAEWGMSVDGRTPVTINEARVATQLHDAPYILMGIVVGLLGIAAVDVRAALVPDSPVPRRSVDQPQVETRVSGKAVAGLCVLPLALFPVAALFLGFGPTRTLVLMLLLPGVLGPVGTTILGFLALGDIRRSGGKVTGRRLAFFEVMLLPLLLIDALIVGVAISLVNSDIGRDVLPTLAIGIGVALFVDILILILAWRLFDARKPRTEVQQHDTGTPLTNLRFTVPANDAFGSRVVFHFSGLGYRLVDEQPNVWVFERGQPRGGLWSTDIRDLHTTLTVRTVAGDEGELLVSCSWSVRTMGAWVSRGEIRKLEAEGTGLQTLAGGGSKVESAISEVIDAPRFSRKAIVGACLIGLFLGLLVLTVVPVATLEPKSDVYDPNAAPSAPTPAAGVATWAMLFCGLPGLALPIIATILGVVAISDIRGSGGRITGLGLAFFDAVCIPALIANGIAAAVMISVTREFGWAVLFPVVFGGIPALIVANITVLRKLWKTVNQPMERQSGEI